MYCRCSLGAAAQNYLELFYNILDEMIQGMTQAPLTASLSHNFIVQMIPHHEAAIEMSRNILNYTENETLRDIASHIVSEQTKSIEAMRQALPCCELRVNCPGELCRYQRSMDRIQRVMFSRMQNACATDRLNCDFMWEMIPHHQGAVEMSALTLRCNICPELIPILEAILLSQKRGIRQMQALLRELGC